MQRSTKAADYQNVARPIAVLADEYRSGAVDARHSHHRAQLLYACVGVMSVLTEKEAFVVPPLRAVWLPAGTPHEVHYRGQVSLRTLYIEPQACLGLPSCCRVIEVSDFLRALILEASTLPVEYDLDGREGRIMGLLLDEIASMPIAPWQAPMPADERLARICRSIFQTPAQDAKLEDWACLAGMSRCTLARLFRRETGMSFATWRQHVRLLEALSRLAIGHSVTRIALDVGYHSPSAFTAMFHRTFGTAPSRYFSSNAATNETNIDPGATGAPSQGCYVSRMQRAKQDGAAAARSDDGLDPEIRRFVAHMAQRWGEHPPLDQVSFPEARRIAEQVRSHWARGGPRMAKTIETEVPFKEGTVRIRAYDPYADGLRPALVYLHGGGWTIFSIDTHDRLMREYAARAGIVVIGVDYSLSPEVRFPRALEETAAVIRWLAKSGAEINVDPARIALGGDSAGAAMTIAACVELRDANESDAVKAMLLNYGAYDAACSNESYRRYGQGGYMWGPGEMAAFWRNYLGDTPMTHPLACPIHADVHGLPPAFSAVPDCDVMFEESIAMAEKLRRAGVRSHVAIYAGATHSFLEAVSVARIADRAFAEASRWLSDTLRPNVIEQPQ